MASGNMGTGSCSSKSVASISSPDSLSGSDLSSAKPQTQICRTFLLCRRRLAIRSTMCHAHSLRGQTLPLAWTNMLGYSFGAMTGSKNHRVDRAACGNTPMRRNDDSSALECPSTHAETHAVVHVLMSTFYRVAPNCFVLLADEPCKAI